VKHLQLIGPAALIAIWLGLLATAPGAWAGEKLFLTGAEVGTSDNYYTFLGLLAPLGDNHLGDGLVQKYWVDFLGYSYDTNQTITAQAVGVEAMLGYQMSSSSAWGGIFAGARYNNTSLSPDDPGNDTRGQHVWAKGQVEGGMDLAESLKVSGIASYTFGADSFWMRTRLLYRLNQDLSTGPEAIHMGDPNYRAWQFGWVVTGFEPLPGLKLGVKASARITEGADDVDGLVGIELVKVF